MKRTIVSAAALALMLAAVSCTIRNDKSTVADYFFPVEAGTNFIYKLEPQSKHVITVSKIAIDKDGARRMELQEKLINMPTLAGELEFTTEYRIDPKDNAVYRAREYLGGFDEVVALKGPAKVGVKWKTDRWVVPVQEGEVPNPDKLGVSSCEITDKTELEIDSEERDCIRVTCTDEADNSKTRKTFCKGLGYTGLEYRAGKKWLPLETLIKVRKLPGSNTAM